MKPLLLLFCYLFFINKSLVLAQTDAGCSIDGASGMQLLLEITDTEIDTNILSARYQGNLELTECTGDEYSYFDLSVNGTHLLINSTTSFGDFDKNTPKTTNTLSTVNLQCSVNCVSADTLFIQIQVTDTNNHAPEFYKDAYEFKVPIPLMPLTDFTIYGDPIIATDIDFSNQDITYTVEPDDFTITTVTTSTSKDYTAVFSTKNIILITGSREYTLTATDDGSPSLSSSTTVTITVDESQSLDTPSFEDSSYSFNYTLENDVPILKPNEDSITLVTVRPTAVSEPTITGEYSSYFQATFDATTSTIDLTVTEKLPENIGSFIIITLSVSTDRSASTSIVIYLSSNNNETPQFSNHYYTGRYNISDQVELDDVITITSTRAPAVTISGEYADHFTATYKEDTKSCEISVKSSLTTSEQKGLSYIAIVVQASVDDYYDTATLVLTLPERILEFTKAVYYASYTSDNKVTIDDDNLLGFTTDVTDVTITVDDTYVKNFDVKQDAETGQYVISVLEALSDDDLKAHTEIVLTLTATDAFENEAKSVVTIQLPDTSVEPPSFSETVYVANYTEGDNPSVTLDKEIAISNKDDQSLINIALDSYTDYFNIDYADGKWTLKLLQQLPDDILASKREIVIILTASEKDNDSTDQAVLIVNWYTKDAPQFSQEYYLGKYSASESGSVELDGTISLINVENPDDVVVELTSYGENFELVYNAGTWKLNVTHSLDDSVLTKNSELIIGLKATETGNTNEGRSILIIELPTTANSLEFEEAYYVAEYPKTGTGTIEFKNPVKLLNVEDITTVEITVDSYSDKFEVKYSDRWYINIVDSLDDSVLQNNIELIITLIATDTENKKTGESVLVLQLPANEEGLAPKFAAAFYVATYPESGTGLIDFEPPIDLQNIDDPTEVEISLDKYSDNLEVKYESDKWYINITKSFEDSVLNGNAELLTTLIAKDVNTGNEGTSALVLKLPTSDSNVLEFSKPYYFANYSDAQDDVEFDTPIEFLNAKDITQISIILDSYTDNFKISYDSDTSRWYIEIENSLDGDVLLKNSDLVLTLIATETGSDNKAEAALILRLPEQDEQDAPEFSDAYYVAKYPEEGDGVIEFENTLKISNVDDQSTISINLDSYTDNFEVKYETDRWYINITKSLDDSLLHKDPEIVITLIATEDGNTKSGKSALVLQLPAASNDTAPIFSNAYYTANYKEGDTGDIEFDSPVQFENVDDPSTVTITLDKYSENFEVKYEKERWYIHISTSLDTSVIGKNSELIITLTATQPDYQDEGYSVLVLKLPSQDSAEFKFTRTYYLADYPEKGKGSVEFDNPIEFLNVDDISTVNITLDNYTENLEVVYDSSRWYLYIKKALDESVLKKESELVLTLTAKADGKANEAYSALVVKLPTQKGPQFSEAYYAADYPESGTGTIEFENAISFENVDDPTSITITIDNYADNFEVKYDSGKWFLNITKSLTDNLLGENAELVMTLVAVETGNSVEGHSALVLRLPTSAVTLGPEFSEAYYVVTYPSDESTTIEFKTPISFENVDDPSTVTISVDNYSDNFELKLNSDKWYINITKNLDEDVLKKNSELVMTLTATEEGNPSKSYSALVVQLPTTPTSAAPKFTNAYYVAKYPKTVGETIDLQNEISFSNVDDPSTVTITLDNYSDNFEITYESNKWVLNVKQKLGNEVLTKNQELVVTMIATETGNDDQGYATLVLELPIIASESGPIFSEVYYIADYPEQYSGAIELSTPIEFENVDDISKITITLSNFVDNFDIKLNGDTWVIEVKQILNSTVLNSNSELVMTLTATDTDTNKEGYSALVLRLPEKDDVAPIFSSSYYTANYVTSGSGANVVFTSPISITNQDDIADISLTLENYEDNFNIDYDNKTDSWIVKVTKQLNDEILLAKTDLVVALTATNLKNDLTDHAAIDLILPYLNTENAPQFSKTYYTAQYTVTDGKAAVTFDNPLNITNKENLKDVSISLDSYSDNFKITYDEASSSWQITVDKNLDQSILNQRVDLVTQLTATEVDNDEIGQASLIVRLPVVNLGDAPKFSSIYYYGTYTIGDKTTVQLEKDIAITNKDDLSSITISFDDSYSNNFEIVYKDSQWGLNIKSPLTEDDFKDDHDLILTLTATETDTDEIGQAALVLHLPYEETKLPPKFSQAHYTAKYIIEDSKASIVLNDPVTIVNKADLDDISVALDFYDTNFGIQLDSTNQQWNINVINPLLEETLNSTRELVLTLTATETDNNNEGETTLIVTLPSTDVIETVEFNQFHYTAHYNSEGNGSVSMDDKIQITTKDISASAVVYIEKGSDYEQYFSIEADGDAYVVKVTQQLPTDILDAETDLILTLVATLDEATSYATLIIYLPNSGVDTLRFSEALYAASYEVVDGKGKLTVADTINVQTAETSDLEASFSSNTGYESYFKISYSNKVVTVTLSDEEIPSDVLRSNAVIPLILTVKISGTTTQTSSVLNVELNYDEEERIITFSNLLYGGTYQVTDGKVTLTIIDQIDITTDEPDANVEVTITNEYDEFFSVSYANKVVTIASTEPLTSETLSSFSVVSLTLQASIKDTTHTSSAVLNLEIKYDGEDETDTIEFATVLHTGNYSVVNDKGQLVSDDIKVITTRPDTDIEAEISDESEYRSYFSVAYANKVVTVAVQEDLPADVLKNNAFIALKLVIGIKDTALTSSAVLNIDIDYEETVRSISFSDFLYTGSYEVKDGNGVLTIDKIAITTDEPDSNVQVAITNEYESFFTVAYSNKEVTLSINKPLTDTILNSTSVVPLTLLAEITGTSVQTIAVVNIEIEYDGEGDTNSIEFGSVLYTGEYSVSDEKLVHDSIQVITTSSDDLIEASISADSEYRDYFTVTYSAKVLSVDLKDTLPAEVTEGNSFIALTLIVGIKDTVHTSSSVLNININSGGDDNQGSIAFSKVLYTGKYEIVDNTPSLTTDTITVVSDVSDESITISVSNEYASYFSVEHSAKTVTIKIATPLTEEILTSLSVVPLTLQAEIQGTTRRALAVINIDISYNDDGDTGFIQFASILYTGEYLVSDGKGILQMDDTVSVITNSADSDVNVAISGGSPYRDYFDVSYADKLVTVELLKSLPEEAVKSTSFINLTLTAAINGTVHSSSSVLNIEIEGDHDDDSDDDEDKTELHHLRITFIVVTAVLSVLLLACIAGAFAYYFLRIRGDSYDNLEEEGSGKVRFGKNSLTRSPTSNKSSALEERRPTGFIFHPINEDMLDTSDSPNDVDKGRRKSVAFDDNVEKMQIDTVDDDTDAYSSDKSQVTHV